MKLTARVLGLFVAAVSLEGSQCIASEGLEAVGRGAYRVDAEGHPKDPPSALYRSGSMSQRAVPTNQWYSSLIFSPSPSPIYATPLSVRATLEGLEMGLPSKLVVPTERRDVEIQYPHQPDLIFSPEAFKPAPATLDKASDWSIEILQSQGAEFLRTTVTHGSPYVYFQLSRGDLRVRVPTGTKVIPSGDARTLVVQIGVKPYAVYGPTGVRWEQQSAVEWIARMPRGKGYFSAAALPDLRNETLALLARHAYSFIEDSRVTWHYEQATGAVKTTYQVMSRTMEGTEAGPLIGLYPHHWRGNPSVVGRLEEGFETVRGTIKLMAANQFSTVASYHGFVPFWPSVQEARHRELLAELMKKDVGNRKRLSRIFSNGSYWQGKGLARLGELMSVVEQQGDLKGRDAVLSLMKERMQDWFSGRDSKFYFRYDQKTGSLLAYPEEYFSVEQMNDHHFHYGYWIRAAAQIALRDPDWAQPANWGGVVDKMIADIATAERGRADFPFLRNFDPYEGHSWASGVGLGDFGNNQESSSEAVNAWSGLILWGEIQGNRELRDLGIYLYTTEIKALDTYWFNLGGEVFAPEYKNVEVSMVFGGKYAHNTWWTDEPRQIHGINLLPLTAASTYLGRDPNFIARNLGALPKETEIYQQRGKRATPPDIWQDIFAQYQALADPAAGLARWDRWGDVELGDTRSHALHWIASLSEMGVPDFAVQADAALYAVFRRGDGVRTYLAYNASQQPIVVNFSDGYQLTVGPRTLAKGARKT